MRERKYTVQYRPLDCGREGEHSYASLSVFYGGAARGATSIKIHPEGNPEWRPFWVRLSLEKAKQALAQEKSRSTL